MTFHSLSIFCRDRVLSLYSTSHLATQARTPSLTVPFWTTSKSCQGMSSLKNISSVLIYPYRSWCSICKQLHLGLSLKNSFMLSRKILHYFRSTICHSHILIRNVVVLPLTFLLIQASPQVYIKAYALITLSKCISQLRDGCTSP